MFTAFSFIQKLSMRKLIFGLSMLKQWNATHKGSASKLFLNRGILLSLLRSLQVLFPRVSLNYTPRSSCTNGNAASLSLACTGCMFLCCVNVFYSKGSKRGLEAFFWAFCKQMKRKLFTGMGWGWSDGGASNEWCHCVMSHVQKRDMLESLQVLIYTKHGG